MLGGDHAALLIGIVVSGFAVFVCSSPLLVEICKGQSVFDAPWGWRKMHSLSVCLLCKYGALPGFMPLSVICVAGRICLTFSVDSSQIVMA